jgi:hypothetical protein
MYVRVGLFCCASKGGNLFQCNEIIHEFRAVKKVVDGIAVLVKTRIGLRLNAGGKHFRAGDQPKISLYNSPRFPIQFVAHVMRCSSIYRQYGLLTLRGQSLWLAISILSSRPDLSHSRKKVGSGGTALSRCLPSVRLDPN